MKEHEKTVFKDVVAEAKRFLKRAEALSAVERDGPPGTNPRECAAMTRASMDLSRALSVWRLRNKRTSTWKD